MPLWRKAGLTRDELARRADIQPTSLSGYNKGRLPLGVTNARKIAAALNVTLADLGAPADLVEDGETPITVRLEAAEDAIRDLERRQQTFVQETVARLVALEAAQGQRARRGGRQR